MFSNARPHMARVSMGCLCHVEVLPWPARSPDISPMEHVWDQHVCICFAIGCLNAV
uniref:Uncharacterized protein n=1 Tax=Paramormyrops kingsleyae TaxID=1676925 RepID=A0A3B3SPA9_9TELE